MTDNEPPDPKFELKERFVWKWHPHGWLLLVLVLAVLFVLIVFAR